MQDADCMRGGESAQHTVDLWCDLCQRPCASTSDQVRHRTTFGQLHRIPRDIATTIPIVDRNDGGMRELRCKTGLTSKATDGPLISRDVLMQQLQRNLAAERQVADAPH